jgi:hypothetical protein
MQATIYSFEDLTRRKRAEQARSSVGEALPQAQQFVGQLEGLLRRLADLHLRISLARLPLAGLSGETAALGRGIVDNLRDPGALAGQMPDGSVVAVFVGPRSGTSPVGDEEMSGRITGRFDAALRATGADRTDLIDDLAVVHCWSDEIFDVASLALDLANALPELGAMGANDDSRRRPA